MGQEVRRGRRSGAVLSSGAEADTCSSRISVRGDTYARRTQEDCSVGLFPHTMPELVFNKYRIGLLKGSYVQSL